LTEIDQRTEFTVSQLTRFVVEGAFADVVASRLTKKPNPYDVQRELYEAVIDRAIAKMGTEADAALREAMATPEFPNFASGLWLEDGFILPIVAGHSEHVGRIIGMLPADRPLFSMKITRGGWFDVRYSKSAIFATEDARRATALAYGQVVAHSTREIFSDGDALAIGLDNAWKLANS
jgi:hypothetical protein